MNGKKIDITGKKYGRLIAVERLPRQKTQKYHATKWKCICDCGKEREVFLSALRSGATRSCGCLMSELARERMKKMDHRTFGNLKHAMSDSSEWNIWCDMRRRCRDPRHAAFKNYGGRGIIVCERWEDFTLFYRDMGPRPSEKHSMDRIDNNGPYSPKNCRWATAREQGRNQRRNHWIEANDEKHTLIEWSEITGIKSSTIRMRLTKYGKTPEQALGFDPL